MTGPRASTAVLRSILAAIIVQASIAYGFGARAVSLRSRLQGHEGHTRSWSSHVPEDPPGRRHSSPRTGSSFRIRPSLQQRRCSSTSKGDDGRRGPSMGGLQGSHAMEAASLRSPRHPPFVSRARRESCTALASMSAAVADEDSLPPGTIVAFETDARSRPPAIGLVVDKIGKKKSTITVKPLTTIFTGGTATVAVALRQVKFIIPGGSGYNESDLLTLEEGDPVDESLLDEAWQMLLEEGAVAGEADSAAGSSDPRGMAQLLFGVTEPSPRDCYRAFRLLEGAQGSMYFKRRRDGYYQCRSSEAVEQARHKLKLEDAVKANKEAFAAGLQEGLKEGGGYRKTPLALDAYDAEEREMLEGLKALAVLTVVKPQQFVPPTPEEARGKELLSLLGRSPSAANALSLCVQLGLMHRHENLFVLEAGIGKSFSEEAMEQARAIADAPPPDPDARIRLDLRHLKTYAVDSEDTMEVDDGLSIESLPDGAGDRIWVHIADVSRWVPEDSPLYLEAKRRRTTTYLPEGSVPMFPAEIAHGVLSLRPGEDCYALSMGITLGEGGEIEDVMVTPSLVKVTYRLTYEDVEDMLVNGLARTSDEWELGRLDELARLRFSYRCSQGSVDQFQKTPGHVVKAVRNAKMPGDYEVTIKPEDPSSRAVRLVTEMMVLVGEGMGMIGAREKIALPYRHQNPPEVFPRADLNLLPEKYCRAQAAYKLMSGAVTATTPQQHWGLGLRSYVQWSSPIRRFLDMIAHYQIKRWLSGQETMAGSLVMSAVEAGDGKMQTASRVMRNTQKYWVTEYLSKIVGRELEAYVTAYRDTRDKGGKVVYQLLLVGLGVTLPYMEAGITLELGETVMVKIINSSARNLYTKIGWRRLTAAESSARVGRLGHEEAITTVPDLDEVAKAA